MTAGRAAVPITLVTGTEEVLVSRAVDDAVASARDAMGGAGLALERRDVDGSLAEAAGVLAEALSPTLFGDPAAVVIRGADTLEEESLATLASALADPAEGIAIVVVHPGGARGKKVLALLRDAGAEEIPCPAVKKGRDAIAFITDEFRRRDRRASTDAVRVLYDAVGHDLALLVAAVAQLCSDIEQDPLDVEAVRAYFCGVAEAAGYQVSDAVWERRPVDALRDLRWVAETQGRASVGPALTAALASGLRSLARVHGMPPAAPQAEVAAEAGVPPWKVRILQNQARRWKPEKLAAATVRLADLDVDVKGGRRRGAALDPEQKMHELENFVVRTASVAGESG
ncbi:MAG: DNA polymerase III subunit delta [bacterium]